MRSSLAEKADITLSVSWDTVIPRHQEDARSWLLMCSSGGWLGCLQNMGKKQVLGGLNEGQVEFRIFFKSIIPAACVLGGG